MALGTLGRKVSDALSQSIKGAGDLGQSTIELARTTVVEGLHGAGDIVSATVDVTSDTLAGAIHAAGQVGAELGTTVKGAVVGTIPVSYTHLRAHET